MPSSNKAFALTTTDNPHSYFNEFREWFAFDAEKGYDCCGKAARVCHVTRDMSTIERDAAIEEGLKNFVKADPTGLFTLEIVDCDEEEWIPE